MSDENSANVEPVPVNPVGTARAALVERLFREHNQALLRFLISKLHSEQEARDVAQEAYVRILKLDTPEAVSHLRAFLFKTAANLAIDRLRTRRVEARTLELEFFAEPSKEPAPDDGVAAREELQLIAACLEELPPKCRKAFMLRRLHGMSAQQVSIEMNIPIRTIRHYIVEAVVYCRSRLEAALGAGRESDGDGEESKHER